MWSSTWRVQPILPSARQLRVYREIFHLNTTCFTMRYKRDGNMNRVHVCVADRTYTASLTSWPDFLKNNVFSQSKANLKDLGLSELRFSHVHDVLRRLLPSLDLEEKSLPSAAQTSTAWKTSHVSAPSFFQNKYGESSHNITWWCHACFVIRTFNHVAYLEGLPRVRVWSLGSWPLGVLFIFAPCKM